MGRDPLVSWNTYRLANLSHKNSKRKRSHPEHVVTPKNLVGTVEWPVLLVVTGAIAMEQALWAFVIIGQETPSFLEMLGKFLIYLYILIRIPKSQSCSFIKIFLAPQVL